ncbi:universal stress protein [Clostridiales Family XIII bacterium RF-744-FAT-WT-3]|uniref:Universal stress protein n=1 Tax=Baileyella intestinalis TaxID=2606709 RepID=A0A6A8M7P7_9FIRM|nr:universal stress protein [Baileyella intestinalis]MST69362.1 universal stress protein [Baileyella intestinalis]
MRKILVPVDGSGRSLKAVDQVRASFAPSAFEVVLLMVQENAEQPLTEEQSEEIYYKLADRLGKIQKKLDGYKIEKRASIGKAGEKILACAREIDADMIIMTKSTSSTNEVNRAIGSTASFVIRNSDCPVMLVPENVKSGPSVYHGMVIRKASGTITLKGQLNFKQTECLLPSVKGKSVYRIETLKGSVRYVRKAYDPETLSWDLPPEKGEHQLIQINEGEMIYIPVNMDESTGKADRIRIINRSMRSESVFRFRIMTVAQAEAEARAREIEESRAAEEESKQAEAETAEEESKQAEAEAAEEARKQAEAQAAEEARRKAEAEAAEKARRQAEAEAAEKARRQAEAEALEKARRQLEAEAAEEARKQAEAEEALKAFTEGGTPTPEPEVKPEADEIDEFQEIPLEEDKKDDDHQFDTQGLSFNFEDYLNDNMKATLGNAFDFNLNSESDDLPEAGGETGGQKEDTSELIFQPDSLNENEGGENNQEEGQEEDMEEMYRKLQDAFAKYDAKAAELEAEKEELTIE